MNHTETMRRIRLGEIAYARSGDKGSGANVAVIAHTADGFSLLRKALPASRVQEFFKPMGVGQVTRYELANLGAFNFILPGVLAGGASRSLRIDAQGKTLGQALLELNLEIAEADWVRCRPQNEFSQ